MKNYDYIIVGAGASGLLMAYRMAKDTFFDDKRILIIDKEKKSTNDRTWCYWEKENGDWDDILTTSWKHILFKSETLDKVEDIQPYQYKMIRSRHFYQKIWEVLEKKTNITFHLEHIIEINQKADFAEVKTSIDSYTSKVVLNSILLSNDYKYQKKYPVLQQHFKGYFIKSSHEIFQDDIATFMDFSIAQKGNTRFMYVLPYSKTEALFEYTLFSEHHLPIQEYENAIEDYLRKKGITDYEIIETEQGSIPMTCYPFWNKNSKNVVHIGTAGGWSKASTGFTFKNINRNTAKLLEYLKTYKSLSNFHKKNRFWYYDLLLLDVLHARNELGALLFTRMFNTTSSNKILRFLDEETTVPSEISFCLKMPRKLFSRYLLKRIFF